MEDFATFCKNMPKAPKAPKQQFINLTPNPVISPKTSWLTKNRLWNFVFWIGMSLGISTAFSLSGMNTPSGEFSLWSSFVFWLTILGVPLTVRHFSKTTFIKDSLFLDKEGNELNVVKNVPNGFFTISTTIAITVLTGSMLDKTFNDTSGAFGITLLISVFFLIPTLFFIFKNCPISILFNRKFWHYLADNAPVRSRKPSDNYYSQSGYTGRNIFMSPVYKNHPGNIFHRNR